MIFAGNHSSCLELLAWLLHHTARGGLSHTLPKLLSHLIRHIVLHKPSLHFTWLRHAWLHHAWLHHTWLHHAWLHNAWLHHSWLHHAWCRWHHSCHIWLPLRHRLRLHSHEISVLRLDLRLSCSLDQPVSFDNCPALLFR